MTTNIYDGNKKVMATDSRWSIPYGPWLFYLDDTGYEKIERFGGYSLMFAGNGDKIQEYKDWIRSAPADDSGMPIEKGMSVCMIEDATGVVAFQKHQDIESQNVLCAGSGSLWAFGCWMDHRCSKQAVETAKSKDNQSGGDTKFIDFSTAATNLVPVVGQADIRIDTVTRNILTRGIAMKIQTVPTGVPNLNFPKAPAANASFDEATAREEAKKLAAAGQLNATAPCAGMHNDWSPEDKSQFKHALGKMFGWKS
ncbi:MAG: hypothetical protein JWR56_766 [Massilia sp.]|nr:hypothetical protein [Massilia sp.]